jgi:hypothetical protein
VCCVQPPHRHGHTGESWQAAPPTTSRLSPLRGAAAQGALGNTTTTITTITSSSSTTNQAVHQHAASAGGAGGLTQAEASLGDYTGVTSDTLTGVPMRRTSGDSVAAGSVARGGSPEGGQRLVNSAGAAGSTGGWGALSEAVRSRRASREGWSRRASQDHPGSLTAADVVAALQQRIAPRRGGVEPAIR